MRRIRWMMGLLLWALFAYTQNSVDSMAEAIVCEDEPFVAMTHYSRDRGTAVLQLAATLSPSTVFDTTLGLALDNNSDGQSDLWILIDLSTRSSMVITATNLSIPSGVSVHSHFSGNRISLVSAALTAATPIALVAFDRCNGVHKAKHLENGKCVHYRSHPGPHDDFSDVEFWR